VIITVELNGRAHTAEAEPRTSLSDFIRGEGLTGTKVGCEQGVCGACTVQLDGEPIRSCLMLAVQAQGHAIRTVESLAGPGGELNALQQAFHESHALQCGFCTPGFLMTLEPYIESVDPATLDDTKIREALAGNLCRCTGYQNIVTAVQLAVERRHGVSVPTTTEA
jgi:aerobic-type carbon monoxide dehydrogenase small subunit (CoxS/CutS family)